MTPTKPNTKVVVIACILMVVAFCLIFYSETIKEPLKVTLESGVLTILLWVYVIVSVSMHRFLYGESERNKSSILFVHFGRYAETGFSIGTYGFGGSTSIALLKGLYLQNFYSIKYFKDFSVFDLISMLVLSSFLLIYSLINTTKIFKEVAFYSSAVDVTAEKRGEVTN